MSEKKSPRFAFHFKDGSTIIVDNYDEAKEKKLKDERVIDIMPVHDPNLTPEENYLQYNE